MIAKKTQTYRMKKTMQEMRTEFNKEIEILRETEAEIKMEFKHPINN